MKDCLKVGELVEFLLKQDQDAHVLAYDQKHMDYRCIGLGSFKSVRDAKAFERRKIRRIMKDLPKHEVSEQVNKAIRRCFGRSGDGDVVIGLLKT